MIFRQRNRDPLHRTKILEGSGFRHRFHGMSAADPFAAIADRNRRYLLEELRRSPKTVNELAAGLPITRPAVSQHLKALLDCGLVTVRPMGTRRIYAVKQDRLRQARLLARPVLGLRPGANPSPARGKQKGRRYAWRPQCGNGCVGPDGAGISGATGASGGRSRP